MTAAVRILVISEPFAYGRGIVAGIAAYARGRPDWALCMHSWQGTAESQPLPLGEIDGVVGLIRSSERAARLRAAGVPAVNASSAVAGIALPAVLGDDEAIGRLAGRHLLDGGARLLVFAGGVPAFCAARLRGLRAAGAPVHVLAGDADLAAQLGALPRPFGVFAYNDFRARTIHAACHAAGLRIPHDAAIVGVDDDGAVCESCTPPLSSVANPAAAIGHAAAALLDRLLAGAAPPSAPLLVPPLRVTVRASSDAAAVDDPLVTAALRLMRERLDRGIDVDGVLRALAVSRSALERRFVSSLGRGPGSELRRLRLRRAEDLLAAGDAPIRVVARQAGFSSHSRLSAAFVRATGMTPSEFRRRSARPLDVPA